MCRRQDCILYHRFRFLPPLFEVVQNLWRMFEGDLVRQIVEGKPLYGYDVVASLRYALNCASACMADAQSSYCQAAI